MPEQLWQTTLNPESRKLLQLTIDDLAETNVTLSTLMGDKVSSTSFLGHYYVSSFERLIDGFSCDGVLHRLGQERNLFCQLDQS